MTYQINEAPKSALRIIYDTYDDLESDISLSKNNWPAEVYLIQDENIKFYAECLHELLF